MSMDEEQRLAANGTLLMEPDAKLLLATGMGRFWPSARGVWSSQDDSSSGQAAWVNEEDHLKLISHQQGADLHAAFRRLCALEKSVREALDTQGLSFAWTSHLGFLSSDPGNLGTCLCVEVLLRLPMSSGQRGFRSLCKRLGFQARSAPDQGEGVFTLSNVKRLGSSEAEQVAEAVEATHQLIAVETRLEAFEEVDLESMELPKPLSNFLNPENPEEKA